MKPQEKGLRCRRGIWYVNLQIDGKRKEFRIGPDKQKAIAARAKLKLMAVDGTLQEHLKVERKEAVSFAAAIEEHWQQHLRFKKSGKVMYGCFKSSSKFFENRDISTLTWEEIETFRNFRLTQVKPSTVKKELDMLHAVLNRQVKKGRLNSNPADHVEKPKYNDVREEIISHADFIKLLSTHWVISNRGKPVSINVEPHVKLALIICDFTGMRIGEVLAMKWEHIRGDCDAIFIPESKNQMTRTVPVHPELRKILLSQEQKSDSVVNFRGKRVRCIKTCFNSIRSYAGLPNIRIHDFRHRATTRWVQEGHSMSVIMRATGHRTVSAFMRYANLKTGDVQTLVGKKTETLPVLTYEEYLSLTPEKRGKSVARLKVA